MTTKSWYERIPAQLVPAHLACAVTTLGFVALGSGASCDRRAEAGSSAAKAPPSALSDNAPVGLDRAPSSSASAAAPSAGPATASAPERPASEASEKRRYAVAALGDSITDHRSHGGGYIDYVKARCPESSFDDYGKGGDMTNQMRRRFENDILPVAKARGYTHLVVFGGVNDLYSDLTAGRTNDRIESDLSAIYAEAHDSGMAVVALTVAPWGGFSRYFDARRGENTRLLNGWISAQVPQKKIERVVDAYTLLSCGDPELLCPEYAPPFKDGLHPGKRGHEVLGKALFETAFADCR